MSAMTKKEWMAYIEKTWDAAQKEAWSEPQFECPRCGHCCQAEVNKDMKPKFMQLLEKCILDGVVFGHDRAYKHNPTPERYQINEAIVNEVMNEIHEWFDFDEGKA